MEKNNNIINHEERPLITFALIAYNQERFIREAVEGAFSQAYSPLEIVISDDCSTDRTFEIMRQMAQNYKGPHKVVLNRNEHNLGLPGNVNRTLDMASGKIVVIAAGDDISLPDRTEKSWQILEENPDAMCVSFGLQVINGDRIQSTKPATRRVRLEKYSLDRYIRHQDLQKPGASRAFRKSVYDYFGPLSHRAVTEDSTMFLRCLMLGTACYSHDVAIYYRVHGGNLYASNNKYLLNYKRIYWQYVNDIAIAVQKGAVNSAVAERLKMVLGCRLRKKMLWSNYYLTDSKVRFFLSKVLFSSVYGPREKAFYLLHSLRAYVRDMLRDG